MGRFTNACALVAATVALSPSLVHAGGREFPGDGTRAMGRGGAGMARADTPRVMTRNPALLADLPGTILELNQAISVPDACFQASGAYGLQIEQGTSVDVVQFAGEDQPLFLDSYLGEPYPNVCYSGGYVFIPSVVLGGKVGSDTGWALGFIPPDINALSQWGNIDGTIDTPNGKRPSPTRYTGVHQNATFFSLQGALGYRIAPWLRIGAGLRWSMVVFQGATMATALQNSRKASNDGWGELTGRDLFIPGFNVSLHAIPDDSLDIALGFRWEDAMRVTDPKLDVITNVWGPGRPLERPVDGGTQLVGSGLPVRTDNIRGVFDAPPLIVPQLSFGVRYSDRIKTRTKAEQEAAAVSDPAFGGGSIGDSMETERWDIELDVIYYMTSVVDRQTLTFRPGEGGITRIDVNADGSLATLNAIAGKCLAEQINGQCPVPRENIRPLEGRDQWTFRLGGDWNVVPGRFALRAGFSYEQRGVDPNQVFTGNSSAVARTGLHAGFTWRMGRTDISASFAQFMSETIDITFSRPEFDPTFNSPENHTFTEGDGAAYAELPDNDNLFGDASVNAGRHTQSTSVFAIGLAQHF